MPTLPTSSHTEQANTSLSERRGAAALGVLLFAYVLCFRVYGLSDRFGMYVDQINDWQIALRPFADLPLVGVPTSVGGFTLGPVYYWLLWVIARVVGPFFDGLPHAGGYGLAVLQSLADVGLWVAISARVHSRVLALAIVLFASTTPMDASFASTIWTAPVAVMFSKIALALLLWRRILDVALVTGATAAAWFAVQAHMTGIFVAGAALIWVMLPPLLQREWRTALGRVAIVTAVIAVLQIPWAIHAFQHAAAPFPSAISESFAAVSHAPLERLRLRDSGTALVRALNVILFDGRPATVIVLMALILGGVTIAVRLRDAALAWCAVAPICIAVIVFAVWQGGAMEFYWYLVLVPSVAICLLGWTAALPRRAALFCTIALLLALAVAQPRRARSAWTGHAMPYGALLAGTRSLINADQAVSEIRLGFSLPARTEPAYLFMLLGGRMAADAPQAVIDRNGGVQLIPH